VLKRLFSSFPGGRSGIALLILRSTLGLVLIVEGRFKFAEYCWFDWATLVAGSLITAGFATPVAAFVAGVGAIANQLSLLPACVTNPFTSESSAVLGSSIVIAVILLGPGAFSFDARLFGRREIIIPRMSNLSR
jgi:uncharacterized membrane protein YphA (DoxX/SURF4 family)